MTAARGFSLTVLLLAGFVAACGGNGGSAGGTAPAVVEPSPTSPPTATARPATPGTETTPGTPTPTPPGPVCLGSTLQTAACTPLPTQVPSSLQQVGLIVDSASVTVRGRQPLVSIANLRFNLGLPLPPAGATLPTPAVGNADPQECLFTVPLSEPAVGEALSSAGLGECTPDGCVIEVGANSCPLSLLKLQRYFATGAVGGEVLPAPAFRLFAECENGIDDDGRNGVDNALCDAPLYLDLREGNPDCDDGFDNDGDGFVDGLDGACSAGLGQEGSPPGTWATEPMPALGCCTNVTQRCAPCRGSGDCAGGTCIPGQCVTLASAAATGQPCRTAADCGSDEVCGGVQGPADFIEIPQLGTALSVQIFPQPAAPPLVQLLGSPLTASEFDVAPLGEACAPLPVPSADWVVFMNELLNQIARCSNAKTNATPTPSVVPAGGGYARLETSDIVVAGGNLTALCAQAPGAVCESVTSGGAVSGICSGGSRNGLPCDNDLQCDPTRTAIWTEDFEVCTSNVCNGGSRSGLVCIADTDCPGGFCPDRCAPHPSDRPEVFCRAPDTDAAQVGVSLRQFVAPPLSPDNQCLQQTQGYGPDLVARIVERAAQAGDVALPVTLVIRLSKEPLRQRPTATPAAAGVPTPTVVPLDATVRSVDLTLTTGVAAISSRLDDAEQTEIRACLFGQNGRADGGSLLSRIELPVKLVGVTALPLSDPDFPGALVEVTLNGRITQSVFGDRAGQIQVEPTAVAFAPANVGTRSVPTPITIDNEAATSEEDALQVDIQNFAAFTRPATYGPTASCFAIGLCARDRARGCATRQDCPGAGDDCEYCYRKPGDLSCVEECPSLGVPCILRGREQVVVPVTNIARPGCPEEQPLRITSSSLEDPDVTVALTGRTLLPEIVTVPGTESGMADIDFGRPTVGEPVTRTITLRNAGDAGSELRVVAPELRGCFVSSALDAFLARGDQISIPVTFTATLACQNPPPGELVLRSNAQNDLHDPDEPDVRTFNLTVQGLRPSIATTLPSFGAVNSEPVPVRVTRTLEVSNRGEEGSFLRLTTMQLLNQRAGTLECFAALPAAYKDAPGCSCAGMPVDETALPLKDRCSLSVGQRACVDVTFVGNPGCRYTGTTEVVRVISNSDGEPATQTAVRPEALTLLPAIATEPAALVDFGTATIGEPVERFVRITNSGEGGSVLRATVTPLDTACFRTGSEYVTTGCALESGQSFAQCLPLAAECAIGVGEIACVKVTFTAAAQCQGIASGTLSVTSNAQNIVHDPAERTVTTLGLTGRAVPPGIDVPPVDFGSVNREEPPLTVTRTLAIRNPTQLATLTVSDVRLIDANVVTPEGLRCIDPLPDAYAVRPGCECGGTSRAQPCQLPPGTQACLDVSFRGNAGCDYPALGDIATVRSNSLEQPLTPVQALAAALVPAIGLSPEALDFGGVPVGGISAPQGLTIANAGTAGSTLRLARVISLNARCVEIGPSDGVRCPAPKPGCTDPANLSGCTLTGGESVCVYVRFIGGVGCVLDDAAVIDVQAQNAPSQQARVTGRAGPPLPTRTATRTPTRTQTPTRTPTAVGR